MNEPNNDNNINNDVNNNNQIPNIENEINNNNNINNENNNNANNNQALFENNQNREVYPNQTLSKEKIQAAFAQQKLNNNQTNFQYNKENISINIIAYKKGKNENAKMDIEKIETLKSDDLIESTSTKYG